MSKKIKMTRKQFTERMWDLADTFDGNDEKVRKEMLAHMAEYLREQGLNEAMDLFDQQCRP